MAYAFLNQLRRVSRGALATEDQRCSICMEDYGTTPSENGIIEHAVELPCGHTVGSECIARWVSTSAQGDSGNITCHLCRRVLFQIPSPSPWQVEDERIHSELLHCCITICMQLGLRSRSIACMAFCIASGMHRLRRVERNEHAVAAASVYVASHLQGDSRSLELVAGCVHDVGIDGVRSAYNMLYCHRRDLLIVRLLARARAGVETGWLDRTLPSILL